MFESRRVLVVGPSAPGDMAWFVALSLRRLGAATRVLDQRRIMTLGLRGRPGVATRTATARVPRFEAAVGSAVWRAAQSADLVLTVKGEHLGAELVADIAKARPIVNWYSDHPFFDQVFDRVGAYTLFCPKDEWSTRKLAAMGFGNVRTLMHAGDPHVLGGDDRYEPRVDLTVLGTTYPYRRHWIAEAAVAGATLRGWGFRRRDPSFPGPYSTRQVVGRAQGTAFRTGTATLNTHTPKDVAGGNQRVFDAAAAGVAQLTELADQTVAAFEPGTEVLCFSDRDEFRALVERVRADPAYAEHAGARARRRLLDAHTYEHRLRELGRMLA